LFASEQGDQEVWQVIFLEKNVSLKGEQTEERLFHVVKIEEGNGMEMKLEKEVETLLVDLEEMEEEREERGKKRKGEWFGGVGGEKGEKGERKGVKVGELEESVQLYKGELMEGAVWEKYEQESQELLRKLVIL